MTRKTREIKMTIKFIQLVINKNFNKGEINRIEKWLDVSYEGAKSEGKIEVLERK